MQRFCLETRGKETNWKTYNKCKDNVTMYLKEISSGYVKLIDLAQGMDKWRAVVKVVMTIPHL